MAELLLAPAGTSGLSNPKFVLMRISDGAFWSTSGTPAFVAYNAANIANYGITATERGSTGVYYATNPSDSTPAKMLFVAAAGASLAVSDLVSNIYFEDFVGQADAGGGSLTAADVWTYATRTVTGPAPSYSPVHARAQLRIVKGESYGSGAVKDIAIGVSNGGSWPTDLSDYTWTFVADGSESATSAATFTGTVAVTTATGSSRAVQVTIAASTTASLAAGQYNYALQGTKTSGGQKAVPQSGTLLLETNAAG
jgi:hypothetical protein